MLRLVDYYSGECWGGSDYIRDHQLPLAPESPQSWHDLNSDIFSKALNSER